MDTRDFMNMTPEERARWTQPWAAAPSRQHAPISAGLIREAARPPARPHMKLAAVSPALALIKWAWKDRK